MTTATFDRYAIARKVAAGEIELADVTPDYERSPLTSVAPLDRAYTLDELKTLNAIGGGGRRLRRQAHSVRIMFYGGVDEVKGQVQCVDGIRLYYSKPVMNGDRVVVGRECSDRQMIVASFEQMRERLNPANLQLRQPMSFNPGDYTLWE
jgi:hypothetical protein